jgi:GntR family transcriptional repressor for pyruvate dehydrogenase complex
VSQLFDPIQRDTLTNSVIRQIEQIILEGKVKPGDWLPSQTDLAAGLGVGLSTVREATRGLALMGILRPQAGRGTQVSLDALVLLRMINLVRNELRELNGRKVHEARRLIEAGMTELAAQRATEQDISRIKAALLKMEQSLDDDEAYIEADLVFHSSVAQAAKNDVVEEFYQILLDTLSDVMRQIVKVPGLKQRGLETQQEILEAIESHDVDTARKLADYNIVEWDRILVAVNGED